MPVRAGEAELRALMIGGLAGQANAQRKLLQALAPVLRAFFARRLRGAEDDVEDLVQDSLIAIHTRRATYDPARPFTAWAYAIARYKMIDHFRRRKQTLPIDDFADILSTVSFEEASGADLDIRRLLDALPPKQAQAIRATKIDGLSVAEAAARGGISESDVKVSVHRGLKTLEQRLSDATLGAARLGS